MSESKKLDKEIESYMAKLTTKQKKAVLEVVKSLVEEEEVQYANRTTITEEEIERRFEELESGKVKGLTFEELMENVRKKHKEHKAK